MGRPASIVLSALLVLFLAACSSGSGSKAHAPAAPSKLKPRLASIVHVLVFDGDLGRPVRGALVRIGRHRAHADARGLARLRPRERRRSVAVYVAARGYDSTVTRVNFGRRPAAGVRIYKRSLQWPMYGANERRTQTQPNIHLRPPFRVVWSRGLGGLLEFPAVVSDGIAFIANAWGSVRALRMGDGRLVWRHDVPRGKMASSPAVVGDAVVVHGMDGHVWVLDRHNGRLLWSRWIGAPIESSPLVWNGVDYFGSWNGDIYALDLRTHRLRWVRSTGAKITSSASRDGRTIFIGDYGGRIWALSATSGRTRWVGSVNGRIYGTPAVADGRVFVPSSDGDSMTAFSTGGSRLWTVHTGAYVYSSPAVWNGRVYFGSYNGTLYCVSAATGAVIWSSGTGGSISGSPAVVGDVVYFSNFEHRVYAFDARTGRRVLRFPDGAYVPVSGSGGRLLLHGYSRVYAVDPRR